MRLFRFRDCVRALLLVTLGVPAGSAQPVRDSSFNAQHGPAIARRTGYLKHSSSSQDAVAGYILEDVWDNTQYFVLPRQGLDLESHVHQLVDLYGRPITMPDGKRRGFLADRALPRDAGRAPNAASELPRDAAELPSVGVQPAAFEFTEPATGLPDEIVTEQLPSDPPPAFGDEPWVDGAPGGPCTPSVEGCDSCATCFPFSLFGCLMGCGQRCCNTPERIWFRGEYLLWWTDGLDLPALVTTSPAGTARSQAGVLGESGTTILFGESTIHEGSQSGVRLRAGLWIDGGRTCGIEGEYFWLGDQTTCYAASSTGTPILARPFFDMLNARETAELVAFPQVIEGNVQVQAATELRSAGIRLRRNICCGEWEYCHNPCTGCAAGNGYRMDWLLGYRYLNLQDRLGLQENLMSLDAVNPGSFVLGDQFDTDNEFHGVELGVLYEARRGPWLVELLSKVALGNTHQTVTIAGFSNISESGTTARYNGGLLAQRSNIGSYSRDEFSAIPELGITVGRLLTPRLRITVGYSLIYFSNVLRAGDQIDLDLNPNLLAPEADPFSGPLRPAFAFHETDFWTHGLSFGGDYRW